MLINHTSFVFPSSSLHYIIIRVLFPKLDPTAIIVHDEAGGTITIDSQRTVGRLKLILQLSRAKLSLYIV